MAAVSSKGAVAKKSPVAKTPTKVKAKPKGLQLSAAQWKAYNKAYSSAATQGALKAGAARFRKYRLQAAVATNASYNKIYKAAQVAAIAAYATHRSFVQSGQAHQNAALQARIGADSYKHANILGRLQYAQAGEKKYAARAVARTVDTAQSMSYEEKVFAAAAKARKNAARSVSAAKKGKKPGAASKAIAAAANKAGLKAAAGVTGAANTKTASQKASSSAKATASKTAKATAHATAAKSAKATAATSAQSAKAPTKTAKGRTAAAGEGFLKRESFTPWLGKPETPNCVAVAIANHLLYYTGIRMDDVFLSLFTEACYQPGPCIPSIRDCLETLKAMAKPSGGLGITEKKWLYELCDFEPVPARYSHSTGLVIGYESAYGPHAAISLQDGAVVSWGQEIPNDAAIEEAWMLDWAAAWGN